LDLLYTARSVDQFAHDTGLPRADAEAFLRRHVNVCVDACHLAVEFEEPKAALERLRSRGIRIGKLQISAGLSCELSGDPRKDAAKLTQLEAFCENVYLHQVVERSASGLRRFLDLPDALSARRATASGSSTPATWRVHFHVPIFERQLGLFESTGSDLCAVLDAWRETPFTDHLEVETYTFDVLPPAFRADDLPRALSRELTWARDRLLQAAAVDSGDREK
jgi:hypothetical protein